MSDYAPHNNKISGQITPIPEGGSKPVRIISFPIQLNVSTTTSVADTFMDTKVGYPTLGLIKIAVNILNNRKIYLTLKPKIY